MSFVAARLSTLAGVVFEGPMVPAEFTRGGWSVGHLCGGSVVVCCGDAVHVLVSGLFV